MDFVYINIYISYFSYLKNPNKILSCYNFSVKLKLGNTTKKNCDRIEEIVLVLNFVAWIGFVCAGFQT